MTCLRVNKFQPCNVKLMVQELSDEDYERSDEFTRTVMGKSYE